MEPLLLTTTRVSTYEHNRALTGATGFFFERDDRLFLVTSRHVVFDEPTKHFPNRIEIELHSEAANLTRAVSLSPPQSSATSVSVAPPGNTSVTVPGSTLSADRPTGRSVATITSRARTRTLITRPVTASVARHE